MFIKLGDKILNVNNITYIKRPTINSFVVVFSGGDDNFLVITVDEYQELIRYFDVNDMFLVM